MRFLHRYTSVLAAALTLFALPTANAQSRAQKALVYCPSGGDAAGCSRIVTAIKAKFTGGVDRGYDGTQGTADIRKVDLDVYDVIVVPSLADGKAGKPYAMLREVKAALRFATTGGRVAVFSGTPDQGTSNRAEKDAMIANLTQWAAAGHRTTYNLVGLVAFEDLSENVADRYNWVKDISPIDVSSDDELQTFNSADAETDEGSAILDAGGHKLS